MSLVPVLVVDDNPVNLTLARLLLKGDGYEVRTAVDAEQALDVLKSFRPELILVDVQLPGMDGLELTRTLRKSHGGGGPLIVALTASCLEGDEARAIAAGCDGYVSKPIEPRSFCATLRQYLQRTKRTESPAESLEDLAREFLASGAERSQALLQSVLRTGDSEELRTALHQWAGLGGTFGYPEITRLARRTEGELERGGATPQDLQRQLYELASVFTVALRNEMERPALPNGVAEILGGKRVALIGFNEQATRRIATLLEAARAFWRRPTEGGLDGFDLAIVHLTGSALGAASEWPIPALVIGPRAELMESRMRGECRADDFLFEPWDAMEVVLRASMLLRERGRTAPAPASLGGRKAVVIADDDPTTIALVRATLQNYGFECMPASDGGHALELMRTAQPRGAILDVNMPNMDGFEVLAAARHDPKMSSIRVILLTARQQESDVLRGFALGADDYVVKPFSPMELTARLKRLLA